MLAYKPQHAAEQIGCSRAFIYRLMERGELPSVKIGASRRILHDDLVAFLKAHRDGAAGDAR
jgi:excisionase family DNA binding protein